MASGFNESLLPAVGEETVHCQEAALCRKQEEFVPPQGMA